MLIFIEITVGSVVVTILFKELIKDLYKYLKNYLKRKKCKFTIHYGIVFRIKFNKINIKRAISFKDKETMEIALYRLLTEILNNPTFKNLKQFKKYFYPKFDFLFISIPILLSLVSICLFLEGISNKSWLLFLAPILSIIIIILWFTLIILPYFNYKYFMKHYKNLAKDSMEDLLKYGSFISINTNSIDK